MRTQSQTPQRRILFRKRLLGRLGWGLGMAAVLLITGYFLINWMLEPLIERQLRHRLGGVVYLDSVRWTSPGRVRLSQLVIAPTPEGLVTDPLVRIGQMECRFSLRDLLRWKVNILAADVRQAQFLFDYDMDQGRWNFTDLQFVRGEGGGASRIPILYLHDSTLQVRTRREGRVTQVTTVGLDGQFISYRQGREYHFKLSTGSHLALSDSGLSGVWRRGPGEGQIQLNGQIRMPRSQILGNAWDLHDIRFDCQYSPRQTQINECSFAMGECRASLKGTISYEETADPMDLHVRLDNFAFGPRYQKDTVVYSESLMEVLDFGFNGFLTRFAPVGRGDLDVQITGSLSDLGRSRVEGFFLCRDVTVTDSEMPYALRNVSGKILLEKDRLVFDNLTARHGTAQFTIRGGVDNIGSNATMHSLASGTNLTFDHDLYKSLPTSYKELWLALAPSGTGNIEYEFQQVTGGRPVQKLRVDLISARAVFNRFLYPLENLTGTLIFNPDRIEFRDVATGYPDPRKIVINGDLQVLKGQPPRFNVEVRAQEIPVDDTLRRALPKPQRELLDQFDIDGRLSMQLHASDTDRPGKEAQFTGDLQLAADSFLWKPFPVPLTGVTLNTQIRPEQIEITVPAASYGAGTLEGSSLLTFTEDADRPAAAVRFSAQQLPLDEPLWEVLSARLQLPHPWSALRADGAVDLSGQFALNTPDSAPPQITLICNGNRIYSTDRMWATGPTTGTVHIDGSRVELENILVPNLPVDGRFADLLPASARPALQGLDANGTLNLTVNRGRFEPGAENGFNLSADGMIGFDAIRLPSLHVSEARGVLLGQFAYNSQTNFPEGSGNFQVTEGRLLDRPVFDLSGPWAIDPNSRRVSLPTITAHCSEGRIFGNAAADFSDPVAPPRYELHSWFNQMQIRSLLQPDPQAQTEHHPTEGILNGAFSMSGPMGDMKQARGRLQIQATQLKIEPETLLGDALTLMGLQKQTDYVFDEMLLEADLQEAVFSSPRVLLQGKNSVFQGAGQVDLEQQTIQMDLTAFGRRAGEKPTLLNTLAENLGASLARVEVTGDLHNPIIRKIPLPLIQKSLEFFGSPLEKNNGNEK